MKQYKKNPDGFTDVRGDYRPTHMHSKNTKGRILHQQRVSARQEAKKKIETDFEDVK